MNQHRAKHNRIKRIKDLIYKYKQERNYYKIDQLRHLLKLAKKI